MNSKMPQLQRDPDLNPAAGDATAETQLGTVITPKRRARSLVGTVAVAAFTAVAAFAVTNQLGSDTVESAPTAPKTVAITRRDLVQSASWTATLGYSDTIAVVFRRDATAPTASPPTAPTPNAPTPTSGAVSAGPRATTPAPADPAASVAPTAVANVLTSLASAASTVASGGELYRVNDQPVILLEGPAVLWRTLAEGMTGSDVAALETALVELGHDPAVTAVADAVFDANTTAMVAKFQAAVGQPVTGRVPLGTVVMTAGPVRIGEARTAVGDALSANADVMLISSTAREALFAIDPAQRDLLNVGDTVQVRLPDRSQGAGQVIAISSTVDPQTGTYRGVVRVTDVGTFTSDQLQVSLSIEVPTLSDALTVPPNALVALDSGGYQVRVARTGGAVTPVAVAVVGQAGRFVAVLGDGLNEGMLVIVP